MNLLKKMYYTINCKKDALVVMGKLTECEAYKNCIISMKKYEDNNLLAVNTLIDDIEYDIRITTNNGLFYLKYRFTKNKITKKQRKCLKNTFKNKGYIVNMKFNFLNKLCEYDNIYISWDHWKGK